MGYTRHHAIIVTAYEDNMATEAYLKAKEIFGACPVSEISKKVVNGYRSFAIFPDGSKEGWHTSNDGDEERHNFIKWLRAQNYLDWVSVQFGDDNGYTEIDADSDEGVRANRG